jgi:hypothetical protein
LDICIYGSKNREQCKEWRHIDSPCLKKFKTQKSSNKVLASVSWDKDLIFIVDFLEKVAAITAKYYIRILDILKQQVVSKCQGKL